MHHSQPTSTSSIIELIDDALTVVSAQQSRKLLNLLDETHQLVLAARSQPTDLRAICGLRSAAQLLGEASSFLTFQAGSDFAWAVESLTSRLLVNARPSDDEWRRVLTMEEHAFALLAPRRS